MSDPVPVHPSEDFTQQVKQVLENLHDFGYLQNHPLSAALEGSGQAGGEAGWEKVRREILLAIEALSPGPNPPISSPRARSYHILNLHYLEEIPLLQCAQELGISIRQTSRELRRAEQSVAAILWAKLGERLKQVQPVSAEPLRSELEQIRLNFEQVDMGLLLQEASLEFTSLAAEHGVHVQIDQPGWAAFTLTDRMIARQALITIFSRLIQSSHPGDLYACFFRSEETQGLHIRFYPANEQIWQQPLEPFFQHLLERMEWRLEFRKGFPAVCRVVFEANIPPVLLVIDDNDGLGLLLERYLSGRRCRLVTARSGVEGLALASTLDPDAILLDVMMPGMDGWQVLNRLKSAPETRETPVIVCSVFNDPRLARSLGAAQFLPKPLNRDAFLATIQQLGL